MRGVGRHVVVGATLGFVVIAGIAASSSCGGGLEGPGPQADVTHEPAPSFTQSPSPTGSPRPAPPDATVPFAACSTEAPDAASEGGMDATISDAGNASPCDSPPSPRCIGDGFIASYGPGPCDAGSCAFSVSVFGCSGGCIPQVDAADYCVQIAGK